MNVQNNQPNNPLYGITLKMMVEELQVQYGWEGLASKINIMCFKKKSSINSNFKFLRTTYGHFINEMGRDGRNE